jgi:hypothetical protein
MSDTLAPLIERNLLEVSGQVDSARRASAIAQIYSSSDGQGLSLTGPNKDAVGAKK